jgi:ribonucleoside-diphosphate reductase alpha chain
MKRKPLPQTRDSVTHKVTIYTSAGLDPDAPVEVFVTAGRYADGTPGEVFIKTTNETRGGYEQWAILLSLALQYKIPFRVLYSKLAWANYGSGGMTDNPKIRNAKSITDYVIRWLADEFKLIAEEV